MRAADRRGSPAGGQKRQPVKQTEQKTGDRAEIMKKTDERYEAYLNILKSELVPAFGCTEPIAVAYAAACVRGLLGGIPERMQVEASGNIIKNVKSVIVRNTGGMKGIGAAAAAGAGCAKEDRKVGVVEVGSGKMREQGKESV